MPRISPRVALVAFRGPVAVASLAALCGVLGGCGSRDPQIPTAPSTTATRAASFPLTVTRVGGIAGFADNLSIQDGGEVLATTKHGPVSCTIDASSLAVLNEAALQVHDTDQPSAPASRPADSLVVLFGAGTGLLPIEDPRVAKAGPLVNQLLADLTGPVASRKVCT